MPHFLPFPLFLKKICYRCYFSRFVLASLPFCYIHSSLFFLPFIRRFSLKSKKEKRRSNDPFSGAFPVFLKKGGSPPPSTFSVPLPSLLNDSSSVIPLSPSLSPAPEFISRRHFRLFLISLFSLYCAVKPSRRMPC